MRAIGDQPAHARKDRHCVGEREARFVSNKIGDAFFDRAEVRKGGKLVRRGRPPLPNPKQAVKLRLDTDVPAAYRKTGRGWQTRINADLRKARKLKAGWVS